MSKKPESKPEAKKNENTEKAIYTGRRIGHSGRVYQRFELLPKREEMLFRKIKSAWIGYTYKCGKDSMPVRPERTDDARIDNPEWDAQDALVDAKNSEKRAEKKIAASTKPALKTAIEALTPICKGLTYFERRSLIEYLADQVIAKSKRK